MRLLYLQFNNMHVIIFCYLIYVIKQRIILANKAGYTLSKAGIIGPVLAHSTAVGTLCLNISGLVL